jgi:hypothetical protein
VRNATGRNYPTRGGDLVNRFSKEDNWAGETYTFGVWIEAKTGESRREKIERAVTLVML